jgi:dienelactone hydrolase
MMISRTKSSVGLVLAGLLAASSAMAQTTVTDFRAGQANCTYAFATNSPAGLPDLLKPAPQGPAATAVGHLFLPAGSGAVPALVFMHGSGGVYDAMLGYWPRLLNGAGIAMFAVDSFGPRGVRSTVDDQSQVPFAADVADVFNALKLLATHPRVDAKRIAVLGTSRGGLASWRASVERIIVNQGLGEGLRYAAHIQLYSGGCVGVFRLVVKPGVFAKAPQLWIHGMADDYTPIAPCRDYADRIAKSGTPVEFVAIDGAHHKFDQDDPRRVYLRAAQRTLENCPVEIDIANLAAFDRFTNQRLQGDAYTAAVRACSALGANVEGSRRARDQAGQAVIAFLRKTFAM